MATATQTPIDEYLRTFYEPANEYIDGELRPKAMGTKKHGRLQARIAFLLEQRGLEAPSELTCKLSPTRYLIPDVAAAPHIADPYPTEPVLLCVEILTSEDRLSAAFAKCEMCHDWGVPYCWLFNSESRVAWEYHKSGEPEKRTTSDIIHAGDIQIPMQELLANI
jgi:Uma2 family endonuclease